MVKRLLLLFEGMFGSAHPKLVGTRTRNVPVVVETPVVSKNLDAELGKLMIRTVNKREMTAEEKSELAKCLWNLQLGPGGMNQIMAIVKKGAGLEREGDEIELDLAVLDNETMWKLHSFIGSAVRKEAAATSNMVSSDNVEEDVDIGVEMQLTNFPSVEIEKDGVNSSGGSDSSSDSDSSSSDSGSGTSYNEEEVNSTPKGVVP